MTQEEKLLLLKDLCARLPYGVICHVKTYRVDESGYDYEDSEDDRLISVINGVVTIGGNIHGNLEDTEPYLRPMSSMTEKEKKVVCSMNMLSDIALNDRLNYQRMYVQNYTIETFDYFNERKLDYRGLIEKGLALEAPEDMYKIG